MRSLRFHLVASLVFAGFCSYARVRAAVSLVGSAADLPPDLELVIAAAPPIVNFPIMGTLDDRGRLFVGDAAGLNLNRKALEEQLPNRVLMLIDENRDGVFERSTVFADKMTFPQGACWLNGSLYVASPPGIWKLTDTNDDGISDQREMIVGGFDFDGNAADVHGPFLHPNGRLFWCHGRKGHKVVQKDGTLVHEGRASGVWSCRPDGSDVQWHSLGSMDNPVEVDFTREGRIVGVVNLYYNQPRGDTLMHWLYGGVYERPDQLKVIADLPRTREQMPVVHNFGHVAVSGFTRYRSGVMNPAWKDDLFITFFNTQKVVRVKTMPVGATYQATEHEFLKLNNPDAHFTDVIEDADGSLLVLDSGGWFRIGCPSSIAEKPDLRGAIYRVQKKKRIPIADPYGTEIAWQSLGREEIAGLGKSDSRWMVREKAMRLSGTAEFPMTTGAAVTARELLDRNKPFERLHACEALAQAKRLEPAQREALLAMLGESLEPTLEHAAMFAAIATRAFDLNTLQAGSGPVLVRRLMLILERTSTDAASQDALLAIAKTHIDAGDPALAQAAVAVAARNPRAIEICYEDLKRRLAEKQGTPGTLNLTREVASAQLEKTQAQNLITTLLEHESLTLQRTAWRILAGQAGTVTSPEWLSPLEKTLTRVAAAGGSDLGLVLDAIAKLATKHFDSALQALFKDSARPLPLRLRALAASSRPGEPLAPEAFALLLDVARNSTSATAKVDAVRFFTRAKLAKEQQAALAPVLASAGAVELAELLKLGRRLDPQTCRLWAEAVVQSPAFGSIEESAIRSAFSNLSPAMYESLLGPAARAVSAAQDEKKRKLESLAASTAKGRVGEGRKVFENSACVACHKAGELGRVMGPDLSHIGQIRQSRDVLESILFPNATIARDFETQIIETSDGQSHLGAIKSDGSDNLVLIDLAGQEKKIPQSQIIGRTTQSASMMPAGLELALTEQQLLDLVAWLTSLK
jgi:putative membrane-bound dehydrogenase-like protein